jgi:lipoyl(octanoyl) transferase
VSELRAKSLGTQPYREVWQAMVKFTDDRSEATLDEAWVVEHPPVFTLGQAGKRIHIIQDTDIPIVESDRGGQVTYHGPGQLVIYLLIDLRRKQVGVRDLVSGIENSIIELLKSWRIEGRARKEAPGVYINNKKIAALGLRVRRGCSFHGLSLNVAMDLSPYSAINPCGYEGLEVTQLADFDVNESVSSVAQRLLNEIQHTFGYDALTWQERLT